MSIKPVAWYCTQGKDGKPFDEWFWSINPRYVEVHKGYNWKPVYSAPAPELAEALWNLVQVTKEPMKYHPEAPGYQAAKEAAISLLARITPK